ncbi:NYN domain [Burkholderia pseudomallei]|nr:NYN domain [Burkholderia pseudomallei]
MLSTPYSGPREVLYLFIDGGYLSARLEAFRKRWFPAVERLEIDYGSISAGFTKTFYYDCIPAQKESETEEAYRSRRQETEMHFNMLRSLPGWHVSEGLAKWRKGKGSSQKEVDILIAVDILTHTYRRNMHKLAFIAGDQDFRPLLEAVVREGMYVDLWYDPASISRELEHEADGKRTLDLFAYHGFFTPEGRAKHPVPIRSYSHESQPPDDILLERGTIDGEVVAGLYRSSDGASWCSIDEYKTAANGQFFHMKLPGQDADFLKRVYDEYGQKCMWTALT